MSRSIMLALKLAALCAAAPAALAELRALMPPTMFARPQ